MSNVAVPLEPLARAADRVRRVIVVPVARFAPALVVSRERRVVVLGCLGIALSLVLTLWAPLALLALGPLLLGVPHLVADARYLVFRPRLHRALGLAPAAVVLVGGLALGYGVRAGLAASVCAALSARGSRTRRLLVAAAALALLAIAQHTPFLADVVFFHAHNLVAIGLFIAWRPRGAPVRRRLVVPVFFLVASGLVAFFANASPTAPHWSGLTFDSLGETLAPNASVETTARLVSFFAFAQSVHYLVWLRLIPEEDRPQTTPRSHVQSLRALLADIGLPFAFAALAAFFVIVAIALVGHPSLARDVYLGVAYGHGHLELVATAWLLARAAHPREAGTS